MLHGILGRSLAGLAVVASVTSLFGCGRPNGEKVELPLARIQGEIAGPSKEAKEAQEWSAFPSPPADGPKLAPVAMVVPIRAAPNAVSETIGYLRVGARVARSQLPVSHTGCAEGWYAIRPVGFVCVNQDVTIKLDHPIAKAIQVEPDRARPMPYKYAFVRSVAPNYLRVPTKKEQFTY